MEYAQRVYDGEYDTARESVRKANMPVTISSDQQIDWPPPFSPPSAGGGQRRRLKTGQEEVPLTQKVFAIVPMLIAIP